MPSPRKRAICKKTKNNKASCRYSRSERVLLRLRNLLPFQISRRISPDKPEFFRNARFLRQRILPPSLPPSNGHHPKHERHIGSFFAVLSSDSHFVPSQFGTVQHGEVWPHSVPLPPSRPPSHFRGRKRPASARKPENDGTSLHFILLHAR